MPLLAQPLAFRHLTTADGLLGDLKLVMAEDNIGRLWIGSEEGLNIFDGYQLSTFRQFDSGEIFAPNVQVIFCDKKGTLWLATPEGVFYKKEAENKFIKLQFDTLKLNDAPFFGETKEGNLIIAGQSVCYLLSNDGALIKLNFLQNAYSNFSNFLSLEHFQEDEWLMGFRKKLLLVNFRQQKIIKEINNTNIWTAAPVNDSIAMTGSFANDTIALVNVKTGVVEPINNWPTSNGKRIGGYAGTIMVVGPHRFAVATRYNGWYVIDDSLRNARAFEHEPANPFSIKLNNCRRLLVTRSGTVFVHTRGLSFAQYIVPQISSLKSITDRSGSNIDARFNCVTEDKKSLTWLGSNLALASWNRTTNDFNIYPYYDIKSGPQKYKTIRAVVTDKKDRIWVGTYGGGIGMLLPNGKFEQYKKDTNNPYHTLPSLDVNSIVKDRHENFLISTNSGLVYFDPIRKHFENFKQHTVLKNIGDAVSFYAYADNEDNWWIAQEKGLYFYNRTANSLVKIGLPSYATNPMMQVVATDSAGLIYAGGLFGLYIISPTTLEVKKILTKKDGLPSNDVIGLLCDKAGKMWILGNIGVAKYDPTTGKVQTIDARDGMDQSNHSLGNSYLSASGEVFLTSAEGINYFYPEKLNLQAKPLSVFITNVETTDSLYSLPQLGSQQFKYNQNNFSFSYLSVDYQLGVSIQYRYRLVGYDSAFVFAGKQRTVRYANLNAGNYSFLVEATINGKDWYATNNTFRFQISKPFWKTWLFILLSSLFITGAIGYFFYTKVKKIRKEEDIKRAYENKLAQVRLNLLRTQMNPHFLFNSLNSINIFILKNDRHNASGYLTKFSRLMRLILENSRSEWVTLESELKGVELYIQMETLRFSNAFNYNIEIGESLQPENILLPPMLLQPYIENAIWHGLLYRKIPGGLLSIKLSEYNGKLYVEIKDNGVGREAAEMLKSKSALQDKSYGMKITAERIDSVNETYNIHARTTISDLIDDAGNPIGTVVLLELDKIINKT